jgi:carboxyl-terminal processing protease
MRKVILILLCFVCELVAVNQSLKINDIPKVMERFFALHIENKEMSTLLVRRAMKLYVEQFDGEKAYLMDAEVKPFLDMNEKRAKEVLARIQNHDYSDFLELNGIIQESVVRAQALRVFVGRQLVEGSVSLEVAGGMPAAKFPKTEAELIERQKSRMVRFFAFHNARTRLDSADRRGRVYALFEKKVRRGENNYLFLTAEDMPMDQVKVENLLTLRILKCLAKSLDTHTSFFSPEEAYEMRMSLEKQFEGIGVVLSEGIEGVMIAELIKGSPAEMSGQIKINDLLVEIDGVPTSEVSFEEVLEMLKKKDKGEVILGFKRVEARNENFFRVPLLKRPIVMNEERIMSSYEKMGEGIVGKITLGSFYESADGVSSERDIKEAIKGFREKGNLIGLVLDLRENSGGFLSQAVKVAGLFVSNGVIVISKYGKGEVHFLRNIVAKSFYNGPLVVLTSKMSASASEIVAQALQDYGVGLVVGDQRTFGKGSIQYQTVTDAKADMFFKVTVGRYYTVSGKSTQIDGVIADIVVPSNYAPYKIGEKYLEYPLPADKVASAYIDPLTDLDEKTQRLFQMRYLPYTQRVVSFWKKMLPELRKNSAYRMEHDANFKALLKKQQTVTARIDSLPVNTVDEHVQIGKEDLQMNEAVNIVKDMIIMEAQQRPAADLQATGSD